MDIRTETELQYANERFIEMLTHMACHHATPLVKLQDLHGPLSELDAAARERAAQRPFLLLDFRFRDEGWWQSLRDAKQTRLPASPTTFKRRIAVDLVRRALTLAWHMSAGTGRPRPSARLGLSPAVADLMIEFQLEDLEVIADRHIAELRLRWDDRPLLWKRLLDAARDGNTAMLQDIDLQAAQLLAADLMDAER